MGALISLFVSLVGMALSLTMSLVNLAFSLLGRSVRVSTGRRRRRRGYRPGGAAGGVAVLALAALIFAPRLTIALAVLEAIVAVGWLLVRSRGPRTMEAQGLLDLLDGVRSMSGPQFEAYTAEVLRAMGYRAEVLGGSGDQGVDLVVEGEGRRIAVQCKNYARPVGNKPVQEVYAGATYHGCRDAWVVAPAGYTRGAFDLARSVGVELFDTDSLRNWIAQADAAARAREREASGNGPGPAPTSGPAPVERPRAVWHPHPDDAQAAAPAEGAPAEETPAPDDPRAEKDRRDYGALLLMYEEYLAMEERLLAMRERGEAPLGSKVGADWAEKVRRLEGSVAKATGKLDDIEGRNPGLVGDAQVARRAELAGRHEALAARRGWRVRW